MHGNCGHKTAGFSLLKIFHYFEIFLHSAVKGSQMSSYFVNLSNKAGVLTRIASLLFVAMASTIVLAQPPQPLHIRIINAQTNKPIPNERLNVALKVDQIGSVAMATDKNGIILVNYGNATIIRILANMFADYPPPAELYTNYPIDAIVKTGITTGNLCSSASPKARPGELILFEIPKTFIPSYPAPPLPPPPHSDENPHVPPQ